jgi:hypothetical protein
LVVQAEFGEAPPTHEHDPLGGSRGITGSALDLIRGFTGERLPGRWRHWVADLEATGRITLPLGARLVADERVPIRAVSRGIMLVLRSGGVGAPVRVDGRGRMALPAWLRRMSEPTGSVLVAARHPEPSVVVLAPTGVLDSLIDEVVGEAS